MFAKKERPQIKHNIIKIVKLTIIGYFDKIKRTPVHF